MTPAPLPTDPQPTDPQRNESQPTDTKSVSGRTTRRTVLGGLGAATVAGAASTLLTPGSAEAASHRHGYPTTPWPHLGYVKVRRGEFVLGGKPWRFGGTNCYYLHEKSHYMIDSMLNDAKAMGLPVVRAWAFFDGSDERALQSKPYVYNEENFDSLDYAVFKAGQLGIRLVLPLVNNWPDYGGMQQYVKWFLDLEDDGYGDAVHHDRFYTDPDIRACYKAYAQHVIGRRNRYTGLRYRDDPTIMTWELANEPRNRSDKTGRSVLAWADEMSRAISRFAPRQLVAVGDEGMGLRSDPENYPYDYNEGNHWRALTGLPAIDYGTVHLYPQAWGRNASNGVDAVAWGEKWITDHIAIGRRTLHKPVVIEEFGLKVEAATGVPDGDTRDAAYDKWLTAVERAGGAGTQFWILTARQDDGTDYPDYDGFRVLYGSATAKLLTEHARTLAQSV